MIFQFTSKKLYIISISLVYMTTFVFENFLPIHKIKISLAKYFLKFLPQWIIFPKNNVWEPPEKETISVIKSKTEKLAISCLLRAYYTVKENPDAFACFHNVSSYWRMLLLDMMVW